MLELRIRQFLLEHLLALMTEQGGLEVTEQPTSYPRIYGQIAPDGTRTPRQSNLMPRPGQPHDTVTIAGRRVALGDTPRYTPPMFPVARGVSVSLGSLPHQPFMSLSSIQSEMHGSPAFIGSFITPYFLPDFGWYSENGQTPPAPRELDILGGSFTLFETSLHQYWAYSPTVHEYFRSAVKTPGGPRFKEGERAMRGTHYPQERPYAAGFDENGPFIISWEHFDEFATWDEVLESPGSATVSVTVGPYDFGEFGLSEGDYAGTGTVEAKLTSEFYQVFLMRYSHFGASPVEKIDPETGQPTYTYLDLLRPVYIIEKSEQFVPVTEWVYRETSPMYVVYLAGINPVLYSVIGPSTSYYGVAAEVGVNVLTWAPPTKEDLWIDPETKLPSFNPDDPNYFGPPMYWIGVGGYTDTQFYADFISDPEGDGIGFDYAPRGSTKGVQYHFPEEEYEPFNVTGAPAMAGTQIFPLALPQTERERIPFWNGWPEEPTEESRAEVARMNPYIYFRPDFPGPYGFLANPTGPLDVASSWCGMAWESLEYVCDAFYAEVANPVTGELEEKLFGVAIVRESEFSTRLYLSIDQEPAGDWPLVAFFPTADPASFELTFLNGEVWDGKLQPHYHFVHFQWPFRGGLGYLAPFRARLRSKQDKVGKHFGAEAADCPLTLYLESFALDYDLEPHEYYPLEFQKLAITEVAGALPGALPALTAPFDGVTKPAVIASLEAFDVTLDLSEVFLPRTFRVKVYVYVKAPNLGPQSYNPTPEAPFKSNLWRLAPDVTGAEVEIGRGDDGIYTDPVVVPVTLPNALPVVRVHAEVRGIRTDSDPLWSTTVEG